MLQQSFKIRRETKSTLLVPMCDHASVLGLRRPPHAIPKDCPSQHFITRVILEHHILHHMLESLLYNESCVSSNVEKGKVLFQKPRSIWCEKHECLSIGRFPQSLLDGREKFVVLGVVEQKIAQDQEIESYLTL